MPNRHHDVVLGTAVVEVHVRLGEGFIGDGTVEREAVVAGARVERGDTDSSAIEFEQRIAGPRVDGIPKSDPSVYLLHEAPIVIESRFVACTVDDAIGGAVAPVPSDVCPRPHVVRANGRRN